MKQGHYKLSIKPKHNGLDHLEQIGGAVLIVLCIWAACLWGF
tara:strand:- start:1788 stop:1913 length:126 start_codon:yes stop_codon:yes gene_type:complete